MKKEGAIENMENKEIQIEKKRETHSHQTMGMSIGMCFGVSLGMCMGYLLFDHGTTGMCLGLPIGMCIGMAIGAAKDKQINQQLAEKGYKIIEINPTDDDKFDVKISDKDGKEQTITIEKGDMEVEGFQVGDFVYLDEDNDIENVMDEE